MHTQFLAREDIEIYLYKKDCKLLLLKINSKLILQDKMEL